jgi:hypothetical protein
MSNNVHVIIDTLIDLLAMLPPDPIGDDWM